MTDLEVRLSREDALSAARLHHLAYVCGRFCAAIIATLALVLAVFIYVVAGANGAALKAAAFVALAIPAVLYGLLLVRHAILPVVLVRRQLRENKAVREVHLITWSERSYCVRSTKLQSNIPWDDYWRWRENRRVLLLYASSMQYQVVPKRLLPPGALEEIHAYLDKAGVERAPLLLS